jgi:integrase
MRTRHFVLRNARHPLAIIGSVRHISRTYGVPKPERLLPMRKTLNDTICRALTSEGKAQLDIFDTLTPGLALRVAKSGKKSWTFMFTVPGGTARARLALGTYPATPLKDARTRATEAQGLVEAGRDPRQQIKAETDLERPKTIADLVETRLAMEVRGKLRRADEVEKRYQNYIVKLIGGVAVQDFRVDPDYNKVVGPLLARNKMRMAGVLHADLRALMNYAVSTDMIERNRMAKVKTPALYVPRERYLSLDEIRDFWDDLDGAIGNHLNRTILRLCLVTGQRINEVAGISQQEIDWGKRTWTIPKERAKNGDEHVVPLSDLAYGLLRDVKTNTHYLFPSVQDDQRPVDISRVEEALRRCFNNRIFTMPNFTPHDLRRTMATHMSLEENGLEIPELYISHCLNHRTETRKTMTARVYNKNKYLPEKREALDKWGAFLAKLVGTNQMREAA